MATLNEDSLQIIEIEEVLTARQLGDGPTEIKFHIRKSSLEINNKDSVEFKQKEAQNQLWIDEFINDQTREVDKNMGLTHFMHEDVSAGP